MSVKTIQAIQFSVVFMVYDFSKMGLLEGEDRDTLEVNEYDDDFIRMNCLYEYCMASNYAVVQTSSTNACHKQSTSIDLSRYI